ncbi:MAG: hypothetical protein A2074_08560 [Candidatus Aquicultor primus]|uniref:Uncharacterized protein n=1 Tax=Candidatus Aquicultor primus TaxID=1797195 RepID=A0A1F2UQ58_9ACTN|nr:MAG: hypothetical protein A2074_08560 [Candidatus Aquicultor primus]HCG98777.1 hypothetical protein [Actinomycetota bacterium]
MSATEKADAMMEDQHAIKVTEFKEKIKAMSKEELRDELEILNENLEDIEIEKRLILGQTGVHINAVAIDEYRNSFDREIKATQAMIDVAKEALGV